MNPAEANPRGAALLLLVLAAGSAGIEYYLGEEVWYGTAGLMALAAFLTVCPFKKKPRRGTWDDLPGDYGN